MKMSASVIRDEGLTPQLQAELAEFEEVLREYNIDLNPSKYISLTSQEYEDSMQIIEEFLKIQDGFAFEPENNPQLDKVQSMEQPVEPMEEDVLINFDNRVPTPGPVNSGADMEKLYLAEEDFKMESFMDLNLGPSYDLDLNDIELNDLFFKGVDESCTSTDKPVLVAEKPLSSENVLLGPEYIDGNDHHYGRPPVLSAEVSPNDLKDIKEISVNIICNRNHISTDDIPTDMNDIPTDTYDIPTDPDDVSTEPEDYSTDDEEISTNPKNISTDPFATLSLDDQSSIWEPIPFTINTWMMNREKERNEKLKRKDKKTATTSPYTTRRSSCTTSHPRRRLFFENQKLPSSCIPEPGSQSPAPTSAKEKASLNEAKGINQVCVVKKEKAQDCVVVKNEKAQVCVVKKRKTSVTILGICAALVEVLNLIPFVPSNW